MKLLVLVFFLFSAFAIQAKQQILPVAEVSADTLGGAVIMLQMKQSLIISGKDNAALAVELGDTGRQNFFKDMILSKSSQELRQTYQGFDRPTVGIIIARYERYFPQG